MALTKEQKDMLADHYRNVDLYDPSEDPKQEVSTFEPQKLAEGGYCMAHGGYCGMSHGGEVKNPEKKVGKVMHEFGSGKLKSSSGDKVKDRDQAIAIAMSEAGMSKNKAKGGMVGYDDGGTVQDDGPVFSAMSGDDSNFAVDSSTDTEKQVGKLTLPEFLAQNKTAPAPTTMAQGAPAIQQIALPRRAPIVPPAQPQAVAMAPASPRGKLSPDQYDELIQNLQNPSGGQRFGNALTSGLSGLADAMMQGGARAGPGQFQKNMMESQQNQKQNLINALKAKYETQFRGEELGQGQERLAEELRSHQANEAETKRARELTERQQNLADKRAAEQLKFSQGKEAREAAQALAARQAESAAKSAEIGQGSRGWLSKALGIDSPAAVAAQKTLQGQLGKSGMNPVYQTPQAQMIKQQYQSGKITKAQASQMLDQLHGS